MRMSTSIRRGFICRMRMGNYQPDHNNLNRYRTRNTLGPQIDNHSYAVVHCTGYIKNWPPNQNINNPMDRLEDEQQHGQSSNYCLIAIARLQVTSTPDSNDILGSNSQSEFISRHSLDGKFTFVDQRVIGILGYQPQELLDKIFFDFLNPESQIRMRETFENVLKLKGHYVSCYYKIKAKNDVYVELKTTCYAFINPYTNDVEYIVCTNLLNNQSLLDQQQQNQINQLNQLNQHMNAQQQQQQQLQQQTHQQYHQQHQLNSNGTNGNEEKSQPNQIDYSAFTNSVNMAANTANNRVQQLNNLTNQQTAIAQDRRVQQQLQSTMYPPTYDPQMHYTQQPQQQQNTANHNLIPMDQQQATVDYNHHQAYQQISSPSSRSPTTYTQLNTAHQQVTANTWANQWTTNTATMDTTNSQQNQVGQSQRDEMNNLIQQQNMMLGQHHDHSTYEHDLNMNMFNSFPE